MEFKCCKCGAVHDIELQEEQIKMGDFILMDRGWKQTVGIVARVGTNAFCIVGLDNGNRCLDPVEMSNPRNLHLQGSDIDRMTTTRPWRKLTRAEAAELLRVDDGS